MHQKIRDKIRGAGLPPPKSRGALLMELAHEMKDLKEELEDSSKFQFIFFNFFLELFSLAPFFSRQEVT